MKGGKAGRKRRDGGTPEPRPSGGRPKPKPGTATRPTSVAPKKGSRKNRGYGWTSTSRDE